MKKKLILLTDILTAILLFIQIESMIIFIVERFSILQNYSWEEYFYLYNICGIADVIQSSSYEYIYIGMVFIIFLLNFYATIIKIKYFQRKELVKGLYKGFIIFNLIFIILKLLEFYIRLVILMHA